MQKAGNVTRGTREGRHESRIRPIQLADDEPKEAEPATWSASALAVYTPGIIHGHMASCEDET